MIGSPPSCRPECVISSECDLSKACKNNKCVDPCDPGLCGLNARCQVRAHSPMCTCLQGYQGDAFTRCEMPIEEPPAPRAPCTPSPCGSNSECRDISGLPACSCLPNFIGGREFVLNLILFYFVMFILKVIIPTDLSLNKS